LAQYSGGWNASSARTNARENRLNLGCGEANYRGYLNLDIMRLPNVHVQASGQFLPFKSNLFDEVLCTDVIEHVSNSDGRMLLEEICRVLNSNGRLILVTPDLDRIALVYRTHAASHDQVIQHLLGDARDHKYLYTIPLLSHAIRAAGLRIEKVVRYWGPIWAHMVILAEKS
jgi:predicted SAM-dependent methyltransferase